MATPDAPIGLTKEQVAASRRLAVLEENRGAGREVLDPTEMCHDIQCLCDSHESLRAELDAILEAINAGRPSGAPVVPAEFAAAYVRGMWAESSRLRTRLEKLPKELEAVAWSDPEEGDRVVLLADVLALLT